MQLGLEMNAFEDILTIENGYEKTFLSLPIIIEKDSRTSLEIIPSKLSENRAGVETFVKTLHEVEDKTIYMNEGKLYVKKRTPVSFEIYSEEHKIRLYMTTPTLYSDFISENIKKSWEGSDTIESLDILDFFKVGETSYCDVEMSKHYMLPLLTQGTSRNPSAEPLNSILSVSQSLREGERFLFQVLLEPLGDFWKLKGQNYIEEYKNGASDTKKSLKKSILDFLYEEVLGIVNDLVETIFGLENNVKTGQAGTVKGRTFGIDNMQNKLMGDGFKAYFRFYVTSPSRSRRLSIASNLVTALKTVEGSNDLKGSVIKDVKKPITREVRKFKGNIVSTGELSQIISVPDAKMQLRFGKKLNKVENQKLQLPRSYYRGHVPIGFVNPSFRPMMVYWDEKDVDNFMLPKVLMGGMGSGKSTYLQNFILGLQRVGHGIIIFDYIAECESSREIEPLLDPNKTVVIDLAKEYKTFSFTYHELYEDWEQKSFEHRRKVAGYIGIQIKDVINALIEKGDGLPDQRIGIISSAARIVFVHKGKSLQDFFKFLTDHVYRHQLINEGLKIKEVLEDGTTEHLISQGDIDDLKFLDNIDDKGRIIGTNLSEIKPIIARRAVFKEDERVRRMYENKPDFSYNFKNLLAENKTVIIRMAGSEFVSESILTAMVTFISAKIWLIKKVYKSQLDNVSFTHLVYDEVDIIKGTMRYLTSSLTQLRKYRLSPIFAAHSLNQFGTALSQLKAATPTYILLSVTDEDSLNEIKDRLSPITIEECMQLPKYHAVNVMKIGDRWLSFITKTPPQLDFSKQFESTNEPSEVKQTVSKENRENPSMTQKRKGWLTYFKSKKTPSLKDETELPTKITPPIEVTQENEDVKSPTITIQETTKVVSPKLESTNPSQGVKTPSVKATKDKKMLWMFQETTTSSQKTTKKGE